MSLDTSFRMQKCSRCGWDQVTVFTVKYIKNELQHSRDVNMGCPSKISFPLTAVLPMPRVANQAEKCLASLYREVEHIIATHEGFNINL